MLSILHLMWHELPPNNGGHILVKSSVWLEESSTTVSIVDTNSPTTTTTYINVNRKCLCCIRWHYHMKEDFRWKRDRMIPGQINLLSATQNLLCLGLLVNNFLYDNCRRIILRYRGSLLNSLSSGTSLYPSTTNRRARTRNRGNVKRLLCPYHTLYA